MSTCNAVTSVLPDYSVLPSLLGEFIQFSKLNSTLLSNLTDTPKHHLRAGAGGLRALCVRFMCQKDRFG